MSPSLHSLVVRLQVASSEVGVGVIDELEVGLGFKGRYVEDGW